jgi:excisionase family DNA binding protein
MNERVLIPLFGLGTLALDRETFDAALTEGTKVAADNGASQLAAPRRLLTSEAMAEKIGVPESWVEEAARRNEVPSVKIGKYVRFDPDDVLSALKGHSRGARARVKNGSSLRDTC